MAGPGVLRCYTSSLHPWFLHDISISIGSGAGSWTRPYELNIADPLLLAVAFSSQGSQGPIGSQRIYSLVCHLGETVLGGGFKDFLFPSLLGEMIQFD